MPKYYEIPGQKKTIKLEAVTTFEADGDTGCIINDKYKIAISYNDFKNILNNSNRQKIIDDSLDFRLKELIKMDLLSWINENGDLEAIEYLKTILNSNTEAQMSDRIYKFLRSLSEQSGHIP